MLELTQEKFTGEFPDFGETNFHMMYTEDFYTYINNPPENIDNLEAWIIPTETIDYNGNRITPKCNWFMAITYNIGGIYYCAVNSSHCNPILFDGVFMPLRAFVLAGYGAPRLATMALDFEE